MFVEFGECVERVVNGECVERKDCVEYGECYECG